MADSLHAGCYRLIVKPNLTIKTMMESYGFKFWDYDETDNKRTILCDFPDGWEHEIKPSHSRIYLPYSSKEFIILFDVYMCDIKEGETFGFPWNKKEYYYESLLLDGFISYGDAPNFSFLSFPGSKFECRKLIIPKGWYVHCILYFTFVIFQIYDSNNILKYHIRS